jgi:hypothetical protein
MIRVKYIPLDRICQGDILKDVPYIERVIEKEGIIELPIIYFPYVIVLTQDCDLEQDHVFRIENKETQDKLLISVLVAPLYNVDHVFNGEHLIDIGIKSQKINRTGTEGKYLLQNQRPRYHYLDFPEELPIVPSVIDFKHYFSVNLLFLQEHKAKNFICTVSELYRESISQRFAAFLSRIGLPENKF